jgi:hypothetical protein
MDAETDLQIKELLYDIKTLMEKLDAEGLKNPELKAFSNGFGIAGKIAKNRLNAILDRHGYDGSSAKAFDLFKEIIATIMPGAELEEDDEDQIIIYSNKRVNGEGNVIEIRPYR